MALSLLRPWMKGKSSRRRRGMAKRRNLSLRPRCEPLEDRAAPAVCKFTGNAFPDNNWSAPANWECRVGDVIFIRPPDVTGLNPDHLEFPADTRQLENVNDFAGAPVFTSITFLGGDYNILGNAITLGPGGVSQTAAAANRFSPNIVLPATRTFDVTAGTLTLANQISGAGGLTKTGAGTLRLEGTASNAYASVTTVNEGVLELNKAPGAVAVRTLVIGDGVGGVNADVVRLLGDDQIQPGGPVTVNNSGQLDVNGRSNGLLGTIAVIGGNVTNVGNLVTSFDMTGGLVTIAANGALTLSDLTTRAAATTAAINGGTIFLVSSGIQPFTVADGAPAVDLSISSVIDGFKDAGVLKLGQGTMQFTGPSANTYPGFTTVLQGVLELNKAPGVNAVPEDLSVGDGDGQVGVVRWRASNQVADGKTVTVRDGSLLDVGVFADGIGSLTVSGGRVTNQPLSILSVSGVSLAAATMIIDGTLRLFGDVTTFADPSVITGAGIVDPSAPGSFRRFVVNDGTAATDLLISAAISGTGGVAKLGPGTLELAGSRPNAYSGVTRVDGGVLRLNKPAGVNAVSTLVLVGDGVGGPNTDVLRYAAANQVPNTASVTVANSGRVDQNGFSDTIGSLTVNSGNVFTGNGDLAVAALTTAGGSLATGTGQLTLGGNVRANSAAVPATVSGNLALGATTRTFNVGGGTVDDLVISAAISGAPGAGLFKTGNGRLVLSGVNSYTGQTTLGSGLLFVNGSLTTSPIVVSNGVLGGTGTTGSVTMNGGILDPGIDVGILTTGNVVLNAGSIFLPTLSGTTPGVTHDQLRVTGTVTLNNAPLVPNSGSARAGDRFVIIENDGTDPIPSTSRFTRADGSVIDEGQTVDDVIDPDLNLVIRYRVTYRGGTGNDVQLTRLNTLPMVRYILMYPEVIQAGDYTYLVGQLTDPDPDDFQGLYISWGDGSEDQIEYPGLEPFAFYHQYTEPGDYYVFAYWFDLSGEGNFRVLPLTVLPAGAPGGHEGAAVAGLVAAQDASGQRVHPSDAHSQPPAQGPGNRDLGPAGLPAPAFGLDDLDMLQVLQALRKDAEPGRLDSLDALFAVEAVFQS